MVKGASNAPECERSTAARIYATHTLFAGIDSLSILTCNTITQVHHVDLFRPNSNKQDCLPKGRS